MQEEAGMCLCSSAIIHSHLCHHGVLCAALQWLSFRYDSILVCDVVYTHKTVLCLLLNLCRYKAWYINTEYSNNYPFHTQYYKSTVSDIYAIPYHNNNVNWTHAATGLQTKNYVTFSLVIMHFSIILFRHSNDDARNELTEKVSIFDRVSRNRILHVTWKGAKSTQLDLDLYSAWSAMEQI